MDWTLILLLIATAVTFVLWRRARAEALAARAAAAQQVEVETRNFELEPYDAGAIRGYHIISSSGERLDPDALNWIRDGLDTVDVDDHADHAELAPQQTFAPGAPVELIPEQLTDGSEAVIVWDPTMTMRAGSVRENQAAALAWRLDAEEVGDCIVLSETRAGSRRTHVRLLCIHRDVAVGGAPD